MATEHQPATTYDTISISATAEQSITRVTTANGEFVIGDIASPLEYQLGTLAGCITVIGRIVAKEMAFQLDRIDIDLDGDIDRRYYKGETTEGRAGFSEIRGTVTVVADADDATLEQWLATVEDRCPISDNLQHDTPTTLTVTIDDAA